ncbi:MAG: host attachment protein [Phycisphaerales bacterium JB039]
MADDRQPRWIAAVDARHARLLRCVPTRTGWRIEEVGELQNQWEDDHEHGRPTVLGHGPATAPPHLVAPGGQQAESLRRFARDVSAWLASHAPARDGELVILAPPRFLGALRPHLDLHRPVLQIEREVAHLRAAELAAHPAVTEILERPA